MFLIFSLKLRSDGGLVCFIKLNSQLMFPVFNSLGNSNFDRFIESYNNISVDCVSADTCYVTNNEPIDVSYMRCTPCGKTMTDSERSTCGKKNLYSYLLLFVVVVEVAIAGYLLTLLISF